MDQPRAQALTILLFRSLELLEDKLSSIAFLDSLISIFEYLLLLVPILRRTLNTNPQLKDIVTSVGSTYDYLFQLSKAQQTYVLIVASFSLLFFLVQILLALKKTDSKSLDSAAWFSMLIFVLFRCLNFTNMTQIYFILFSPTSDFPLLRAFRYLLLLPILLLTFYSLLLKSYYPVLGYFYLVIPVLLKMIPNDSVMFSIILVYGLYMFVQTYHDSRLAPKILAKAFILTPLWFLIYIMADCLALQNFLFIPIYLIAMLIGQILGSKSRDLSDFTTKDKINEYWRYVSNRKQTKVEIRQEFFIVSIIFEMFLTEEYQLIDNQKVVVSLANKNIKDWTYENKLQILQVLADEVIKTQKQKETELLYYETRLEDISQNLQSFLKIQAAYQKSSIMFIFYRYELYKMLLKLKTWFSRNKLQLQRIQDIVETDQRIIEFYDELRAAYEQMYEIWSLMGESVIDFQVLEKKYSNLLHYKDSLEELYSKIAQKVRASREYDSLVRFMTLMNMKSSSFSTKKNTMQQHSRVSQQVPFLIVSEGVIRYADYKFLEEFKFEKQDLESQKLSLVYPKAAHKQLFQASTNMSSLKIQSGPELILMADGFMKLLTVSVYLYPESTSEVQYILFFETRNEDKNRIYFVYDNKTQIIENACDIFFQKYKVQPDVFSFKKGGYNTTLKEIFENLNFDQEQNALRSEGGYACLMNLKKLQNNPNSNKIPVTLRIAAEIDDIKKKTVILIDKQETPGNQKKKQKNRITHKKEGTKSKQLTNILLDTADEISNLLMKTDAEKFLIQVAEKKEILSRKSNSRTLIMLMMAIVVFCMVFLCSIIVTLVLSEQRSSWTRGLILDQVPLFHTRNQYLSEIMFSCLSLFHLNNWPPPELSSKIISQMIKESKTSLKDNSDTFMRTYVSGLDNQKFEIVGYQLNFSNYQKTVTTDQVVLVDFVWHAALAQIQPMVPFIMDNIGVLKTLESQIINLVQYFDWFSYNIYISKIVTILPIVVNLCTLASIVYVCFKIQRLLSQVQAIFSLMPTQTITLYTRDIKKALKEIALHKASSNKFDESKMVEQLFYSNIQTNSKIRQHLPSKDIWSIQASKSFYVVTIIKILVVLLLVVICFISLTAEIVDESKNVPLIVQADHEMRLEQHRLQNSMIQVYYKLVLQKYSGDSYDTQFQCSLVETLFHAGSVLPAGSSSNSFQSRIWEFLNEDVCTVNNLNDKQKNQCLNVEQGILQSGFSKGLDYFKQSLKDLAMTSLDNLYSNSLFMETVSASRYLMIHIKRITQLYQSFQTRFVQKIQNTYLVYCLAGLGALFVMTILFYWEYKHQKLKIHICKSLFSLLPDIVIGAEQIRNYIQQTHLIDQLLQV